ncbi:hypothetical protein BCR44DRAFT_249125 [Catenaria anguillulae PL171]|uniref:Uncharacterized protein n=1 Tax=Catenaria anguillulae PL171 TaxID=765915 RepID=A0A1Y2HRP8_9FUNG|nr:hypothetical protein BCR44DRAFT_249125 [Catenaria anguillulae PL171]
MAAPATPFPAAAASVPPTTPTTGAVRGAFDAAPATPVGAATTVARCSRQAASRCHPVRQQDPDGCACRNRQHHVCYTLARHAGSAGGYRPCFRRSRPRRGHCSGPRFASGWRRWTAAWSNRPPHFRPPQVVPSTLAVRRPLFRKSCMNCTSECRCLSTSQRSGSSLVFESLRSFRHHWRIDPRARSQPTASSKPPAAPGIPNPPYPPQEVSRLPPSNTGRRVPTHIRSRPRQPKALAEAPTSTLATGTAFATRLINHDQVRIVALVLVRTMATTCATSATRSLLATGTVRPRRGRTHRVMSIVGRGMEMGVGTIAGQVGMRGEEVRGDVDSGL